MYQQPPQLPPLVHQQPPLVHRQPSHPQVHYPLNLYEQSFNIYLTKTMLRLMRNYGVLKVLVLWLMLVFAFAAIGIVVVVLYVTIMIMIPG